MSKSSPLQIVKAKFGSKRELAEKLADQLEAEDGESRDEHLERLVRVSNAKLLHLHALAERVSAHGGRQGLTDKLVAAAGKSKDKDYVSSLAKRSLGWLVDRVEATAKRQRASAS